MQHYQDQNNFRQYFFKKNVLAQTTAPVSFHIPKNGKFFYPKIKIIYIYKSLATPLKNDVLLTHASLCCLLQRSLQTKETICSNF